MLSRFGIMNIRIYNEKKFHLEQGLRIQNGSPFDFMLRKMAEEKNLNSLLSDIVNPTDVSRYAIILLWRKTGHTQIPQKALGMLNKIVEDIDLDDVHSV